MVDLFLIGAAFIAGLIGAGYGTSAGGGALLTAPTLIFLGMPPVNAVATSKLGSVGVASSGLAAFAPSGEIDWRLGAKMAVLFGIGGALGAAVLLGAPPFWVEKAVGTFILGVLALIVLFPNAGLKAPEVPLEGWKMRAGYGLTFAIGVLNGFYQGGSATLAAYVMILFFGQTFLQSAGTRKIPFLVANLVALAVLLPSGVVDLVVGGALFAGTVLGGWFGSKYALSKGNEWVRKVFIVVVAVMGLRLLFF